MAKGGGDGASLELGDVAEELLEAQTHSYELGLMLKLKSHVLDAIHKEETSSKKCLLKVLAEFLKQTDPQPSWRVIIDALNSRVVHLPQLGKRLEAAHFPEPTSTQDSSKPEPTVFPDTSAGNSAEAEVLDPQVSQRPVVVSRGAGGEEVATRRLSDKYYRKTPCVEKKKVYSRHISIFQSETLGSGVYGEVCKAKCDGIPCAAKIVNVETLKIPNHDPSSYLHSLWEELSSARHPNLVQYLGPYSDLKVPLPVLLMELCNENLNTFLERSPGPLPEYTGLNLAHDIALALVYLHSNCIVHGNLTGKNILVVAGTRAKVTDFGFSELSRVAFRLKAPNVHYMSPNALGKGQMTKSDDIFSFSVIAIQILTRQPPQPTSNCEQVYLPQFEQQVEVFVPETKRRESHLKIIPETHPLKPLVLQCLKKDGENRPSAEQLGKRLSELKQHAVEKQESNASQELQLMIQEFEEKNKLIRAMAEEHLVKIREKDSTIRELHGRVQGFEHTIAERGRQMQENQRALEEKLLQQYLGIIAARDREIDAKNMEIGAKNKTLGENVHAIDKLEREYQQKREQVEVLVSRLAQKDEAIEHLQDTIAEQEKVMQELKRQRSTSDISNHQQLVQPTAPMPETLMSEGTNAPEKMYRGAAVLQEDTAYFRPVNSHTVYAYTNILGIERWSKLPDNPNWNFGLAVIEGSLTSVGGYANQLLSLIQSEGGRWQWQAVFPSMPTHRSKVACVTIDSALVVAGGFFRGQCLNEVEVMDIGNLQWTTVCSLPHAWSEVSAIHFQGALYLTGGITDNEKGSQAVLTCTLSNLLSSAPRRACQGRQQGGSVWKEVSYLPVAQSTLACFSGHLVAIGGKHTSGKHASEVRIYDPRSNLWRTLCHMKTSRSMCLAVTLPSDHLIVVGGHTSPEHPTDSVELLQKS